MWFKDDPAFHTLYPVELCQMARRHWTPLLVARKAARFLVTQSGDRILDIGSGAGKFCLAAAKECPQGQFTGIEQRRNLVDYANQALEKTGLTNVEFLHGNITDLNF
jgi:tRNA G46 methylase TrmB